MRLGLLSPAVQTAKPITIRPFRSSNEDVDDMSGATAGMLMLTDKASLDENPFLLDLGTDITPGAAQSIMSKLMDIERWMDSTDPSKHKPIRLICNNDGGDLASTFAIIDQLDSLKQKGAVLETYVSGEASSGAVAIFSHGSKGHRYMSPRSHLMLHQVYLVGQEGRRSLHNAKSSANHAADLNEMFMDTLVANCHGKTTKEKLMAETHADLYLNAKQAIEYGLADKIGVPRVEPFERDA